MPGPLGHLHPIELAAALGAWDNCVPAVDRSRSPAEWSLRYDGETVSLSPSVGNWEYACRSHYWIAHNRIHWAKAWSPEQIEAGRARDLADLETYFEMRREAGSPVVLAPASPWWRRLILKFGRTWIAGSTT
jgi:hypothetical protein